MSYYESIYILRPDLSNEQVEQVIRRVGEIISHLGATILRSEMWGRRDLAYLVKKHAKGFYVFNVLEGNGNMVAELENRLKIDEDVIKYMNVKVDTFVNEPSAMIQEERRDPKSLEEEGEEDL
ncbi:MAG: 30S ribosomal protein S6 [Magnetococcales bacterium]|nr:30S ribosomal protein S6 [Magnetococcales bacterium]NGZ26932.1 30S ribosomal protein S6 [Magnetococcales bacterium]